jgi:hypothetical protein
VRTFEDGDMEAINAWLAAHRRAPVTRDALPATGIIEPGVAAGFVFRTDSSIGFIHGLVTNPDASLRARHAAIHRIMKVLVEVARGLGIRHLLTWSDNPSAVRRAVAHGGVIIGPATIVGKEL